MAYSGLCKDFRDQTLELRLPSGPGLDILIIGKTGHGKTATRNSILGGESSGSSGKMTSETTESTFSVAKIDGRRLLVVDTPGLCDTGMDDEHESHEKAMEHFTNALCFSDEGFHAILLVFRYGQRFSKDEKDAVAQLRLLFGENFIREHGVVILTCGDFFHREKKGKESFKQWCRKEEGYLKTIFEECRYRCLLFDNAGQDKSTMRKQRYDLIRMIDEMQGGKRYTEGIFLEIKEKWNDLGDKETRKAYLESSLILSEITYLLRNAKYDQIFVDNLRRKFKKLESISKNMGSHARAKMEKEMKTQESNLENLEERIQSSRHGHVKSDPAIEKINEYCESAQEIIKSDLFQWGWSVAGPDVGNFIKSGIPWLASKCTIQ